MRTYSIKKKQKITFFALGVALIISVLFKIPSYLIGGILTYVVLVSFFAYVPALASYAIPSSIRRNLYSVPLYIPLFILTLNSKIFIPGINTILLGLLTGAILILINITDFRQYLSKDNCVNGIPLSKKDFNHSVIQLVILVIGEEIYFRLYGLEVLKDIGIYSIAVSAFIFAYSHYLHRWSENNYNLKSYVQHFIVGIATATLYIYTKDITACIIAHLMFNTPFLLAKYRRTKIKEEEVSFDDYD